MSRNNSAHRAAARRLGRDAVRFVVFCAAVSAIFTMNFFGTASAEQPVMLRKIREFQGENFSTFVLQFSERPIYEEPVMDENDVLVRLKNTGTELAQRMESDTLGAPITLEKVGTDLNVRIGLPENFVRFGHYRLVRPDRLFVKVYTSAQKTFPAQTTPPEEKPPAQSPAAPGPPSVKPAETVAAPAEQQNPSKKETPPEKAQDPQPAQAPGIEKAQDPQPAQVQAMEKAPEEKTVPVPETAGAKKGSIKSNDLLTLNFYQSDIQEVLSALAIEREINIATSQDVSGRVSVHLYQVTLDEALNAISLAGGFRYQKRGDLYYMYKPQKIADPQAQMLQLKIIRLKYVEMDKVKEILQSLPGIGTVQTHEASKTMILEDTPENIRKIETIVAHWDQRPKQVMIEAKILEVGLTDGMTFGVDWEKLLGEFRIGTGGFSTSTLPTGESASPVTGTGIFANLITAVGTDHQFAAALDLLQKKTHVNALSTPKILAINGKPAKVQVGGKQGYRVTTTNLGVATETIEFIDTGTILDITPYIDDDDNVLLKVMPSINDAKLEQGIPVVSSTAVSTWLLAKSGETVFIGGLIKDKKEKTRDMIPCFGNIPGLGAAFGRTTSGFAKTELIVLITIRVLKNDLNDADTDQKEKVHKAEEHLKKEPLPPREQMYDFLSPMQ